MTRGEHRSASEIEKVMPGLVPTPRAYGKFKAVGPPTYFYLSDFLDMDVVNAPDPSLFCAKVVELHRATSEDGRFGFHTPTCDGIMIQTVEWESSWAVFYGKLLRGVAELDKAANGTWKELEIAIDHVVAHVIPHLLGALETNGRSLKPSLIHGDLWEGNVGTNLETGDIVLFDAGSYYAHNEMELGIWREEWNGFRRKSYIQAYLRDFPPAEPVEEFDDRNRLYNIKYNLNYSAGYPGAITRQT
jgi:protein-ribulosamine 3-kinase